MIDINRIKQELNLDMEDTSKDEWLESVIEESKFYLMDYCNNDNLDFNDRRLNKALLYICIRDINEDTRFRAGKTAENTGASFSFTDDLPTDIKKTLRRYRLVNLTPNQSARNIKNDYEGGFFDE